MNKVFIVKIASLIGALATGSAMAAGGDYVNGLGIIFASLSSAGLIRE